MKKRKYVQRISIENLNIIVGQRFLHNICPSCKKPGIYAGSVSTEYDEDLDEEIVLSFTAFCRECGGVFGTWNNTDCQTWL